ncbi:MAG: hypothetical protein K0R10_661 [Alphaproteobacteria bacterium]|jgi:hypothetical protein|nr:hypothetical protein [Alphaproteobacteria bacterium]
MSPDIRKTITDAFNAAVATSPYADEVVPGIVTQDGGEVTRRDLAAAWLQDDAFFAHIDKAMAGGKTLEQVIDKFQRGINTSILPRR